jgi:cation:H+ antiporter
LDYIYVIGGLIGLTVVGFGTSTTALLVSLDAAWRSAPVIALGNIVGANIANILLIVGISALVWLIRVIGATVLRDSAVMMAMAVALTGLLLMRPVIGGGVGLVMLKGYAAYIWAVQG